MKMVWNAKIAKNRKAKRNADPVYKERSNRKGRAAHAARTKAKPTPRAVADMVKAERLEHHAAVLGTERSRLVKRVVELEEALSFMHAAPAHAPRIHVPKARPKSGKRVATPCFMVSDTHFGESVTYAESLGLNRYNMTIAKQRMSKCWDNMLWLRADMARTQTCDDTLLVLNGDIITGDIHDELRETNDGGARDQCNGALDALIPGVLAMADATPGVLHIVCIGGNHGRKTHRQQIKNGTQHSLEHIGVYDPMRRIIGDRKGKIAWHIPEAERHIIDVHGMRVSTQHGTNIKSQGGVGGTLVPMTRWVTRDNMADLYLFGHFHECDAYRNIIKNGSLIGESGYSRWLGVEQRPAEQAAWCIDAIRGVRRFERVSVT